MTKPQIVPDVSIKDAQSLFDKTLQFLMRKNAVNIWTSVKYLGLGHRKFLGLETANTRTGTWVKNCLDGRCQAVPK